MLEYISAGNIDLAAVTAGGDKDGTSGIEGFICFNNKIGTVVLTRL